MEQAKKMKSFMVYGGRQTGYAVTGNTSMTDSFNINENSDFYPLYLMYSSTSDSLLLNIRIGTRNIFNTPVLIGLVANKGLTYQPWMIPLQIRLIMPVKTSIKLDFTDTSGSTNTVYFAFVGYEYI